MASSSLTHQNTRVAIYARVSTKDRGQEVENQLRQLREFTALQGWSVIREYVDRETGSTNDRTEFQAMFRDASQRKFDVFLFWALDRLSREGVLETLQHLNRLTACGVGYRSLTEQYFDSCGVFKDAVIAIIATVAKQERVRISQRVRAGLDVARAKGRRLGRPKVVVDVARIANLRAQGRSWRVITDELGIGKGTAQRALAGLPKNV
jgi:DNA invertase Pin-like site-specific DNA recombinase